MTIRKELDVLITPEMAKEWLATDVRNRRVEPRTVAKYARLMTDGRWRDSDTAIAFYEDGTRANGTHRLHACVQADASFTSDVWYDVPPEFGLRSDTARPKSYANYLQHIGVPNTKDTASLVRMWRAYQTNPDPFKARAESQYSHEELEETRIGEPMLADALRNYRLVAQRVPLMNAAVTGTLWMVFERIDAADNEAFWRRLSAGTGLASDDPIFRLRERLNDWAQLPRSRRPDPVERWATIVKAWNAYRRGAAMQVLYWRSGGAQPEAFPVAA